MCAKCNSKCHPNAENPIIIFAKGSICIGTSLYILYRSKLPKNIVDIIDKSEYHLLSELCFDYDFYDKYIDYISDWMPVDTKQEIIKARNKLEEFESFDEIIKIFADSLDDYECLTIDELLKLFYD